MTTTSQNQHRAKTQKPRSPKINKKTNKNPTKNWGKTLAIAAITACAMSAPVNANSPLIVSLSEHFIRVSADFDGVDILFFGAKIEPGNLIVTIRGPSIDLSVHRSDRRAGLWVTVETRRFQRIPSYYHVLTEQNYGEWLPNSLRTRHQIGAQFLNINTNTNQNNNDNNNNDTWLDSINTLMTARGAFAETQGGIEALGEQLFRARLQMPPNILQGAYQVDTLLVRDGRVIGAQSTPMFVIQSGWSNQLSSFARTQPIFHGVVAVIAALLFGFAADTIFRRYY